ncbi:MAG: hypothetical protein NVSMB17_13990 [Candidatus Dormibacteria bacterium]
MPAAAHPASRARAITSEAVGAARVIATLVSLWATVYSGATGLAANRVRHKER